MLHNLFFILKCFKNTNYGTINRKMIANLLSYIICIQWLCYLHMLSFTFQGMYIPSRLSRQAFACALCDRSRSQCVMHSSVHCMNMLKEQGNEVNRFLLKCKTSASNQLSVMTVRLMGEKFTCKRDTSMCDRGSLLMISCNFLFVVSAFIDSLTFLCAYHTQEIQIGP